MDGRQNVYNKLNQIFADAKDSIDYSTSSSGLIRAYKAHSERMEAARKNGAKVRVLSPICAENSAVAQDFSQVIELKRLEEPFIADFAIVDGKELVVTESKPDDLRTDRGSDLGIWTTNRLLIELHGQFFLTESGNRCRPFNFSRERIDGRTDSCLIFLQTWI